MCYYKPILLSFQISYIFNNPTDSGAVTLTQATIDTTLGELIDTILSSNTNIDYLGVRTHARKIVKSEFVVYLFNYHPLCSLNKNLYFRIKKVYKTKNTELVFSQILI